MSSDPRGAALYRSVNESVFALYAEGQHARALAVIDRNRERLAAWDAELALLAACLKGALGSTEEALRELVAAAGRGGWWDPRVLAEDDDLAGLRGSAEFQQLLEGCGERWRAENAISCRSGDVVVAAGSPSMVLVALHGAEEDAVEAAAAWGPAAVEAGAALLAVRSSQRTSPRYRSWPDHDRARQEVIDAWSRLPDSLRELPVVVAGFSAGARVALRLALEPSALPVSAVLAAAPAISVADLSQVPEEATSSGRTWIGADDDLLHQVEGTRSRLAGAGLEIEVLPHLGHALPPDHTSRVVSALRQLAPLMRTHLP